MKPPPGDLGTFFATAAKGTEVALRDELRELGFRGVRADRGGVHFDGFDGEGWRACLELRIAMRILKRVGTFEAPSGEALYEGVRALEWARYLSPRHTLAVRASCRSSALTHTQFIAQKTKDAIVDQLRDAVGARPSVDLTDPDLTLSVHLVRDQATVYVDFSGEPLHRRGYRQKAGEAPLKETLAAAILRLSGWDRQAPLWDPMCGSGTIPIEAALWARDIAPGLLRGRFGFERWASHDEEERKSMSALRERVRARSRSDGPRITGGDIDERALGLARAAARAARVTVTLSHLPIREAQATEPPGYVVTNPPYGERLANADAVHADLGEFVRRMAGHRVAVLAGSPGIARAIPLRPSAAHALYNGAIECRLLVYDVRAPSSSRR
jgi:putative N6-adenine-specific DNA methylase